MNLACQGISIKPLARLFLDSVLLPPSFPGIRCKFKYGTSVLLLGDTTVKAPSRSNRLRLDSKLSTHACVTVFSLAHASMLTLARLSSVLINAHDNPILIRLVPVIQPCHNSTRLNVTFKIYPRLSENHRTQVTQ